jgi:hypothetical protein
VFFAVARSHTVGSSAGDARRSARDRELLGTDEHRRRLLARLDRRLLRQLELHREALALDGRRTDAERRVLLFARDPVSGRLVYPRPGSRAPPVVAGIGRTTSTHAGCGSGPCAPICGRAVESESSTPSQSSPVCCQIRAR